MVDLSNYVLVGRYDLPEPTRTAGPANNLLAQEASGVTYNWDTNTLFVVGDGGTSVTQVSLTGQLINTMTLALGSSPQGTEFYDTEGITYIGGGQFVFTEERYRQVDKFTYAAGTTLTRADVQTVNLGTDIGNVGLEGLTYDPLTSGFIVVKEKDPIGIFQTTLDFINGTAGNGSPTTVESTNLFNPALVGTTDFSDVYALSSNASFVGTSEEGNLLIISQESGKVVEVDRAGTVLSTLTLTAPPTTSGIDLAAMTVEGVTMGPDGKLYLVSEEGGGDFDHPQLWVYAPASGINAAPTAIALTSPTVSILENTDTTARVKVAGVNVTDDGLGTNTFTVTGADAASFEADSSGLYIKAGVTLDYEAKTSYAVTVNVDDTSLGATPDARTNYTLNVTNVVNEGGAAGGMIISEVAPWSSGNSPANVAADWFELTNVGSVAIDLTGWKVDDSSYAFASALTLNGITSVAPGESVIFMETASSSTVANFRALWNLGADVQIGTYNGSGIGLSTGGDAVNVFDGSGVLQASVTFGSSPGAAPFATFDNTAGLNSTSLSSHVTISTLSTAGVNGAYAINPADGQEVGSPGSAGGVAAPVNHAPTAIGLSGEITSLSDTTSTTSRVKVASIVVTDDGLGTNTLTVSGADAAAFEVDATGLYLKAGDVLDATVKSHYDVTVNVDDTSLGATPDASVNFALNLTHLATDVLRITEVAPWSSGNSPVGADWFEVTNMGSSAVNLTGWKMDDNSNAFANAVALSGVTSLAPGESAIFLETSDLAGTKTSFINTWFGGTAPAGLQIGAYLGSGVGLSTGGDAVNLYNSLGDLRANVSFGPAASGPFTTFANPGGLNNTVITTQSSVGVGGAFVASADAAEIGSPGTLGKLIISEVAPWSSGNSPVGADWFEVTNTTGAAIDLTGWKVDDSSNAFANAVALSGVTSIAAGESVIFIESGDLAGARAAFINTWFGGNAPANLQIGVYSGSGIGLSTGGDAVNLYDAGGVLRAGVSFGSSPSGPSYPTFDNFAGLTANPPLSVAGVRAAFHAANDAPEIGSPGEYYAVNDAPVGHDDVASGLVEDSVSLATGNVLTNDNDPDLVQTPTEVLHVSGARAGSEAGGGAFTALAGATVIDGTYGQLTINTDGSVSYTLDNSRAATDDLVDGQHVSDVFTYQVTDAHGLTDTAQISLDITGHNDFIAGTSAANVITGTTGDDVIKGFDGNDTLSGGNGDDVILGGVGRDKLNGGSGVDTASYADATSGISASLQTHSGSYGEGVGDSLINFENLTGSAFDDVLQGDVRDNVLSGLGGADTLEGQNGDDSLFGGAGDDTLIGGNDLDVMTGGAGKDLFVFLAPHEMKNVAASADIIADFVSGEDRIDLSVLDANLKPSSPLDDAFNFVGTAAFTKAPGQVRYEVIGGDTYVSGEFNGNGKPDFFIHLIGVHTLTAGDFIL